MAITVLLSDDHTIVREGLRLLLEAQKDIVVVGEAADGRETVRLVKQLHPDVVIMDIAMPEFNGIAATQRIKDSTHPSVSLYSPCMRRMSISSGHCGQGPAVTF